MMVKESHINNRHYRFIFFGFEVLEEVKLTKKSCQPDLSRDPYDSASKAPLVEPA
jgi:hypothetical protein